MEVGGGEKGKREGVGVRKDRRWKGEERKRNG